MNNNVQRELLTKYLRNSENVCTKVSDCTECEYHTEENCVLVARADALIKTGRVIVMPCKIGDLLWCLKSYTDKDGKTKRAVSITRSRLSKQNFVDVIEGYGKKYFRSKEEAGRILGIDKLRKEHENAKKRQCHICNECATSTEECSWKAELIPVPGWNAEPLKFKLASGKKVDTYKVLECPKFKKGR